MTQLDDLAALLEELRLLGETTDDLREQTAKFTQAVHAAAEELRSLKLESEQHGELLLLHEAVTQRLGTQLEGFEKAFAGLSAQLQPLRSGAQHADAVQKQMPLLQTKLAELEVRAQPIHPVFAQPWLLPALSGVSLLALILAAVK